MSIANKTFYILCSDSIEHVAHGSISKFHFDVQTHSQKRFKDTPLFIYGKFGYQLGAML